MGDTAKKKVDVAIVGLGIMGSAAAFHLARRGKDVVSLDQFEAGHRRGSSHGENRAIRMAYFEGPHYVDLLRKAYAQWDDLERLSGERIFVKAGMLEAGFRGSPMVAGVIEAAQNRQLPYEILTAAEVSRRFPAFRLPEDLDIVFEANAGYLRADIALDAFRRLARQAGADLQFSRPVTALESHSDGVTVHTAAGPVEARSVVVAAGPWLQMLVPELAPRLRLTRQTVTWFDPDNPSLCDEHFPVFALETRKNDIVYGFPYLPGRGMKAASHSLGATLSEPGELRDDGNPADADPILNVMRRYIPGANGTVLGTETCLYTHTLDDALEPDGRFALGVHPKNPRIVLASPCSGHGFKFASIFGAVLADLATTGQTPHDIAAFDIQRLFPLALEGFGRPYY